MNLDMDMMRLNTPADYRFEEALAYLNRSESECLHQVEGNTVYKAVKAEGETVLMVIGMGTYAEDVSIRLLSENCSEAALHTAIAYVRDWLDLDTDLGGFYASCGSDPLLGPVVDRYRGLRLIGVPSLFEALCWSVAGQQINLAFAYILKKRLVEAYGTRIREAGREWLLFPEADLIASLEPENLQELKFTRSKSETLIRIASLIASKELSKEQLLQLDDFRAAEEAMISIRGIGPWTANYVMMRCLRNRDAFPLTDVGLHNAIRRRLRQADKPSLQEVEEHGARWAPWRAYATFYLWSSLTDAAME
jgi:DNA-3-methyladenine glycosylase II